MLRESYGDYICKVDVMLFLLTLILGIMTGKYHLNVCDWDSRSISNIKNFKKQKIQLDLKNVNLQFFSWVSKLVIKIANFVFC